VHVRAGNNKKLPWSVTMKSFWISLIDPGSEVRVVKEGTQKYKEQQWKSHRKRGWFGRK
jgi:hypothetical protein